MNQRNLDDYIDVAARITAFKQAHPEGSLSAEIIKYADGEIIMRAMAYRSPDDSKPGVGHAREVVPHPQASLRGSEVMVCETSAWGRAIAALGFAVSKGVASADEVVAARARALFSEPAPSAPAANAPIPVAQAAAATPTGGTLYVDDSVCPRHVKPWVWKSGTAKATGKPYAFWACDGKDDDGYCKARPSFGWIKDNPGPAPTAKRDNLDDIPF
jgi:hypothetical protein